MQPRRTVGVLLVHGIGTQRPGETTRSFVEGLRTALPDMKLSEHCGRVTLVVHDVILQIYEVYWADILDGDDVKGSFTSSDFHTLAWFPSLNLRAGLYVDRSRFSILVWTIVLAPAAIGAQILYILIMGIVGKRRRPALKVALDNILADVTNYAASAGGAMKPDSRLREAATRILSRFYAALDEAERGNCSEIHIVAHSLGSVIAYHALSGHLGTDRQADLCQLPGRKLVSGGSIQSEVRSRSSGSSGLG